MLEGRLVGVGGYVLEWLDGGKDVGGVLVSQYDGIVVRRVVSVPFNHCV